MNKFKPQLIILALAVVAIAIVFRVPKLRAVVVGA